MAVFRVVEKFKIWRQIGHPLNNANVPPYIYLNPPASKTVGMQPIPPPPSNRGTLGQNSGKKLGRKRRQCVKIVLYN